MASLRGASHPLRLNLLTTETEKKRPYASHGAKRTDDNDDMYLLETETGHRNQIFVELLNCPESSQSNYLSGARQSKIFETVPPGLEGVSVKQLVLSYFFYNTAMTYGLGFIYHTKSHSSIQFFFTWVRSDVSLLMTFCT